MERVFEIATNISTPLMLAGFLAAAFFLILRQIIRKDIFPALSKALSAHLLRLVVNRLFVLSLVALIFGFIGYALTIVYPKPQREEANVKVVKTTVVSPSNKQDYQGALGKVQTTLTERSHKYGEYDLWPALDYRLKNIGGEVGLVTSVDLEIIEAIPDNAPELYFQLLPTDKNDLELRVVNLGWGPAVDVELDYFLGSIRSVLDMSEAAFHWQGTIADHLTLTIPAKLITTAKEREFFPDQIGGKVRYFDTQGKRYEETISYDGVPRYPTSGWKLIVKPDGFNVVTTESEFLFRMLYPSAVYDILLKPNKETPYHIDVPVSQALDPGEPDRFLILIASTQSAEYLIRSSIEIDGEQIVTTDPIRVPIRYKRLIPNFFYREGLPVNLDDADQLKMAREETASHLKGREQRER